MAEDNYPQPPAGQLPNPQQTPPPVNAATTGGVIFPYPSSAPRLNDYDYYTRLFLGQHFSAFNIRIADEQYNKEYAKLRYVMANFAGLVSRICADMLFSEPITVKVPEGDQDFIDAFWQANHMDAQCYESALANSYLGDALFKLRIGARFEGEDSTVIAEDITPKIYFPAIDGFNVRAEPKYKELAWTFRIGNDLYLRKEIHYPGRIENKVYKMEKDKIVAEVPLGILGDIKGLLPVIPVKTKRSLLVHVPNWKTGDRYFGLSDYLDLDSIFYAINNRLTKVDNILDKHGDPILTVPPGVLDDKGQVNKKALGVIEIAEGETGKPEYIVWDAKLESAFSEIEKLVEFMYMTGEISADILGLGEGQVESGKALKMKLMRTIAKVARKKLYYDYALKELLYTAQILAKEYSLKVDGVGLTKDPVRPEIDWQDGLPIDNGEQIEVETSAIDAGLTSKKSAIMRIYGVDEEAAQKMLDDIDKENPLPEIATNMGDNPFGKPPTDKQPPKP